MCRITSKALVRVRLGVRVGVGVRVSLVQDHVEGPG